MSYQIELSLAVRECSQANAGRAFITPPITNPDLRAALCRLAVVSGVPVGVELTDEQLTALYATARKSSTGARAKAERLARDNGREPLPRGDDGFNPFADTAPSAPTPPVQRDEPTPAPTAPGVDLSAVQRLIDRALVGPNETLARIASDHAEAHNQLWARVDNLSTSLNAVLPSLIQEALKLQTPTRLEVSLNGAPPVATGTVHRDVPRILKYLAAGVNVYLHGPAGSGKTTAARQCANALGQKFYFAAKVESEYLLLGFRDAKGEAVRTPFREAYEHGGLFLLDELDASSPGAIVALNAALANGVCPFPDGTIARHADFRCIAAGNTTLSGYSRQYTGRNQLDAASVDRFAFIEFGYDEVLERSLASNAVWCDYVQQVRKAVLARGLPKLVTPRATLDGCTLLAAGDTWENVEQACIWKGLDADTVAQIKSAVSFDPLAIAA